MAEKFHYSAEFKQEALTLYPDKSSLKELLEIDSIVAGHHMRPEPVGIDPETVVLAIAQGDEVQGKLLAEASDLARKRDLFRQWQEMARAALPGMDPDSPFFT